MNVTKRSPNKVQITTKSVSLKAQRCLEAKYHQQMYDNIGLLTLIYPTTAQFDAVFKKDMFLKNNKEASQQVIYYLLKIVDPVKLKQKVTFWPIYNPKEETQFRNEVMKYLNELNTIYEGAEFPKVMTSHLISPGGFKFIKYMFYLSQFVLFQHLKRNSMIGDDVIFSIKPGKNPAVTESYTRCLINKTRTINAETLEERKEFSQSLDKYKRCADEIVNKQFEVDMSIPKAKERIKEIEAQWKNGLHQSINKSDSINDRLKKIQEGLEYLNRLKSKFEEYNKLIMSLQNEDLLLKHNFDGDDTGISKHEKDPLDLIMFSNHFRKFLDRQKLNYASASKEDISDNLEWITTINKDFQSVLSKSKTSLAKFEELSNSLSEAKAGTTTEDSTNSILAMPLECSPEN